MKIGKETMKTTIKSLVAVIFGVGLFVGGCAKKHAVEWKSLKNPEVAARLKSFVVEKEAQANAAEKAAGQETPAEFKTFFAAAQNGDWLAVSNAFADFQKHAPQYEHSGKTDPQLRGAAWQTVLETYGAIEAFAVGNEKYSAVYGNDIIESIPPGSIYFGGTDPGRFIVTAMQKSHVDGDPFFTLTQNALADQTYLGLFALNVWRQNLYSHARRLAKMFSEICRECQSSLEERTNPSQRDGRCHGNQRTAGKNHF